jgi:hypothetical protein
MHIPTYTYGKIPVEIWEYPAIFCLFIVLSIFSAQLVRKRLRTDVSWRYFLPGLWIKLIGGMMFALIYTLYYKGGDTTSYYECTLAFVNLLFEDPARFFIALTGGGTPEIKSLFSSSTGSPMGYMFFDEKTRMVIKLCIPFILAAGKSYFIATLFIALVTYGGLWRLFRMFVSYFPDFHRNLAIGILFMPSVVFWGSGMLKDSFTLAATCYFVVATNGLITRNKLTANIITMVLSGFIILAIKPYILLILFPGTLVWFFYKRIQNIKNTYFRYVVVPLIYSIITFGSYFLLTGLGDSLGRFSPDKALQTAVVIQNDLKQEYYDGASFDIGQMEATPLSIVQKFPAAVIAGLYRPFIWESRNVVMLLSGIENLFILLLSLYILVTFKPKVVWNLATSYPLIVYSAVFSILFAFMIGVTTSNFGALVRFKIPLIPLYMGAIMVVFSHLRQENQRIKKRPAAAGRSRS